MLRERISQGAKPACSPEDPISKIGENLMRIFQERGVDFFDRFQNGVEIPKDDVVEEKSKDDAEDLRIQPMTPEELFKMRVEILPQLQ